MSILKRIDVMGSSQGHCVWRLSLLYFMAKQRQCRTRVPSSPHPENASLWLEGSMCEEDGKATSEGRA